MSADGLTADFDAGLVYLTNGLSTVEPLVVARAIGPHIVRAIEPYRFLQPPRAHVWGTIPMRGEADADLYFDLDGGPFHWWKFNLPHIAGQVHWAGLKLALNQLRADFYGGQANGSAHFDFPPGRPAEFQFGVTVTNVLLHALMADLSTQTNSLEGWLGGAVKVTKANTDDWKSVFGSGALSLRDGLIWEIPLFGIFSPVLNGISPGLGNSRANGGDCTFSMTNGVIRSDDLQIYSTGMRLKYHGTVDLQSRVKARVEAELLRDMWVVGPLVSKFLWPVTKLFEYQVTGTLGDPKSEPVFLLPKLVLLPLHPLRTLKNLVPEPAAPPGTNTFSPPPP